MLTTEPSLQIYQLQASQGEQARILQKSKVVPLLAPAIAMSFYEKDHLVIVGNEKHAFKRTCFEFDIVKTKDQMNLRAQQLQQCDSHAFALCSAGM